MAVIDLGVFTDSDYGGRTTRIEVPDKGDLPAVPDSLAEKVSQATVDLGWPYGLGTHRWVEVTLLRYPGWGSALLLLYAANRSEWVCLHCESYYSAYGYMYGDRTIRGMYGASPALMGSVLRAYGVLPDAVPPGRLERCHPDQFRAGG